MKDSLPIKQTVGLQIIRKAITCSKCGEPRTQDTRCENCGIEVPYSEERSQKDEASQKSD
jgi:ribosomal protein L32